MMDCDNIQVTEETQIDIGDVAGRGSLEWAAMLQQHLIQNRSNELQSYVSLFIQQESL